MKLRGIIIFLAVLLSCTGQPRQNMPAANPTTALTEMTFDENSHDFGTLKAGEIVVYSFAFTNTGKHDLWLEKATSDCGCVTVHLPENPVKSGSKSSIEVEFDSSGLFGNNLKTIDVYANCHEPKHLVIFAEVENEQFEINF